MIRIIKNIPQNKIAFSISIMSENFSKITMILKRIKKEIVLSMFYFHENNISTKLDTKWQHVQTSTMK